MGPGHPAGRTPGWLLPSALGTCFRLVTFPGADAGTCQAPDWPLLGSPRYRDAVKLGFRAKAADEEQTDPTASLPALLTWHPPAGDAPSSLLRLPLGAPRRSGGCMVSAVAASCSFALTVRSDSIRRPQKCCTVSASLVTVLLACHRSWVLTAVCSLLVCHFYGTAGGRGSNCTAWWAALVQ